MSQQNPNNQPSINILNQSSITIPQNNQQIQQNTTSSAVGIQSSKSIQIVNSLNSNINLSQTSGVTYTMDNNNVKPTSLKINQMTGSSLTLLPSISSINSNTTQNILSNNNNNNVLSSGSQTSTNSSASTSSTSTYGGFGSFR